MEASAIFFEHRAIAIHLWTMAGWLKREMHYLLLKGYMGDLAEFVWELDSAFPNQRPLLSEVHDICMRLIRGVDAVQEWSFWRSATHLDTGDLPPVCSIW